MNLLKNVAFAMPALVLVTGCTTMYGTVLPVADGSYEVMTADRSKGAAMKAAQLDAETTCKKATGSKKFVSLGNSAEDVSLKIDRGDGGTTRSVIAGALEFAAKIENKENYEVKMAFYCAADAPPAPRAQIAPAYAPAPASTAATAGTAAPASGTRTSTGLSVDEIVARAKAQ